MSKIPFNEGEWEDPNTSRPMPEWEEGPDFSAPIGQDPEEGTGPATFLESEIGPGEPVGLDTADEPLDSAEDGMIGLPTDPVVIAQLDLVETALGGQVPLGEELALTDRPSLSEELAGLEVKVLDGNASAGELERFRFLQDLLNGPAEAEARVMAEKVLSDIRGHIVRAINTDQAFLQPESGRVYVLHAGKMFLAGAPNGGQVDPGQPTLDSLIPLWAATLNRLGGEIHKTALAKGWWGDLGPEGMKEMGNGRSFGEVLALIHSEVSETLEAYRDGLGVTEHHYAVENLPLPSRIENGVMQIRMADGDWLTLTPQVARDLGIPLKPFGVPTEFADILIRVLDACLAFGIDIDRAVNEKMEFNVTRPNRHGGKLL